MSRHGTFPVPLVLLLVGKGDRQIGGFRVKMDSARLHTFKESVVCVYCGVRGDHFVLERDVRCAEHPPDRAHFNLYATVGGREVLMTRDHIVPLSKGGRNHPRNQVTACCSCNQAKGSLDALDFMVSRLADAGL